MGKDVIIACDFASKEACLSFLDKFTGRKPFVKIGMELFYDVLQPVEIILPFRGLNLRPSKFTYTKRVYIKTLTSLNILINLGYIPKLGIICRSNIFHSYNPRLYIFYLNAVKF